MVRRYLISAAAVTALSLGGCVTVVPASWKAVPDGEAMADAYPGFAADAGIEGRASLTCIAGVDGKLVECQVDEVQPTGLGFEAAALSLTDRFEAIPGTRNDIPKPSKVTFRIRFALPPVEPVLAWHGEEPSDRSLEVAREVAPRFAPRLDQGPDAIQLEGLDAERIAAVQAMIADLEHEMRPAVVEAIALAMARTVPMETLSLLKRGQRRPPRSDIAEEELVRAGDRVSQLQLDANARLKAAYCARYAC